MVRWFFVLVSDVVVLAQNPKNVGFYTKSMGSLSMTIIYIYAQIIVFHQPRFP